MSSILSGLKPDITPAQVLAFLIAGVPHLSVLFGVELDQEQKDAMDNLIWLAAALVGADLGLRGIRNVAASNTEKAALKAVVMESEADVGGGVRAVPLTEAELEEIAAEHGETLGEPDEHFEGELPSDAEEFGSPPPPVA